MKKMLTAIGAFSIAASMVAVQAGTTTTPSGSYEEGFTAEELESSMPMGSPDESLNLPTPNSYGVTDRSISVIPWASFFPGSSSSSYVPGPGINRRCITGGNPYLYASLPDDIPDGALVKQIVFYVYDNDSTKGFGGGMHAYYSDSSAGTNWAATSLYLSTPTSTTGTPGDTVSWKILTSPILIDRRQDINTDGKVEVVSYVLWANVGGTGDLCVSNARILWTRQVSPAPASATFNDVPTTHQFFRYIEALADSGITSGCNANNYCPDDPVTRGQMAVFLAKALGLHWPAS